MGFIKDIIEKSAEIATKMTVIIVESTITAVAVLFSSIAERVQESFDD